MEVKNEIKKGINWLKVFMKLDRLSAWTLLVVIITYGITGYGMTKGLIPADFSRALHLGWLGGIGLLAFIIHTSWAVHLALKRNQIWNIFSKIALASFYILLISFFVWANFFYEAEYKKPPVSKNNAVTINTDTVFTVDTLKPYTGLNGQPAYVAVDGVVYDMSPVFKNGNHHGHKAGQDLSAAFHGEHPDSFLEGYNIVGTYK